MDTPRALVALLLILCGCHDAPTAPATGLRPSVAADALDSPWSGTAEFTVSGEAPLQGNEQVLGHFPTMTIVAMTVHQHFSISTVPPFPPSTGEIGLAGRISGWGCSHQGEAYLVNFPDGGGYDYAFSGCQLANGALTTTFSDTVAVNGWVKYGYSWDSACPYPDYGCAAYTGSSGARITRLAAKVAITSDTLHGGELWAWPRREYTVVAAPTPRRMGAYLTPVLPYGNGWAFKPDSGPEESNFCRNGSGQSCVAAFTRSGSLTLTAVVNGEAMVSAPLRVQVPAVSLAVSRDSVSVGDTVLVTTTLRGADSTILTGYYVGVTSSLSQASLVQRPSRPALARSPAPSGWSSGQIRLDAATRSMTGAPAPVPPCLGAQPVPTRCYVVMKQPGRALVYVGAKMDRYYFGDGKYVKVTNTAHNVKPSLAADTIRPTVRYWKFDAATKTYVLLLTGAFTPDTSRTNLSVSVVDAAGTPVPNATVTLRSAAHEGTAGHVHVGGKPSGLLQTLQKVALAGDTVNTGASGVAKVYFVASEVSGPVTIQGTSKGARTDSTIVQVMVKGLVALSPGAHYEFTGAVAGRHTDNHYGTSAALTAFQALADSIDAWTGEPLGINDISLIQGGLFDSGDGVSWNPWDIPHGFHRNGTHADIRTHYANGKEFPDSLKADIETLWRRVLKHGTVVKEGNHLHVQFYR